MQHLTLKCFNCWKNYKEFKTWIRVFEYNTEFCHVKKYLKYKYVKSQVNIDCCCLICERKNRKIEKKSTSRKIEKRKSKIEMFFRVAEPVNFFFQRATRHRPWISLWAPKHFFGSFQPFSFAPKKLWSYHKYFKIHSK